MTLSVVIITHNEEANIARTLESVKPLVADGKGEIIVVDSGSTDSTVEIAKSLGAKVFVEDWKGYAAQKNSAIDKAAGKWILSLDADDLQRFKPRDAEVAHRVLPVLAPPTRRLFTSTAGLRFVSACLKIVTPLWAVRVSTRSIAS